MTARMGFSSRWNLHRKRLRAGTHHCPGLQRAFYKYGEEALTFMVLEQYSPVEKELLPSLERLLMRREREMWDVYHDRGIIAYNSRPTGTGSVQHSEESNERRRIAAYLRMESSCEIWNRICVICENPYSTGRKNQYTCPREECSKHAPQPPRRRMRRRKRIIPPLTLCSGDSCCNFVIAGTKYCGFSCSYTPCHSPICYNYVPGDRRSGPYCGKSCKAGRGELNPLVLAEMHHDRGMSTHAIGKLLGYSAVAVQMCMERHGIERRSRRMSYGGRRMDPIPSEDELYQLYVKEGVSLSALKRRYHVGDATIKGWLSDAGIAPRENIRSS